MKVLWILVIEVDLIVNWEVQIDIWFDWSQYEFKVVTSSATWTLALQKVPEIETDKMSYKINSILYKIQTTSDRAVYRKWSSSNWRKTQNGAVLLWRLKISGSIKPCLFSPGLIVVLEVSDLVDWKFNICPGYLPKILTLDLYRATGSLRHFMLMVFCAIFCKQL